MRLIRLLKNDLAKEVSEWEKNNIISQSQAIQICEKYGVDYHQISSRSFGYNVLIALGYLFIGLAVITLLGANWDDIPRSLRMSGLIALTLATHALAIKKYLVNRSTLLFLLANLFYGASIILIAQIYHLGEHMPDGVFWWALGCLPIALIVRDPWVMLQSLALALIWFFLQVNLGFYPSLFPVFIVSGLYVLYYGKQSITLFLIVVASIGFWFEYLLASWWSDNWYFDFLVEHAAVSVPLFILAYAVSTYLSQHSSVKAKDYGVLLSVWSLRFGLVIMFIMSFYDPWRELMQEPWSRLSSMYTIVAILSIAALIIAWLGKRLVPVAAMLVLFFVSLFVVIYVGNDDAAKILQVLYNLVLVGTGIGLIIQGVRHAVTHYFFLGVVTILLVALLRYFDLVGDYIGGTILFAVFATILLGAAKFWKINYKKSMHHVQ